MTANNSLRSLSLHNLINRARLLAFLCGVCSLIHSLWDGFCFAFFVALCCSNANACLLKAAHFAAVLEDYAQALDIFESCAAQSTNNNLLKFSVKEYLLKAGLCHLAAGVRVSHFQIDASQAALISCLFVVFVVTSACRTRLAPRGQSRKSIHLYCSNSLILESKSFYWCV